MKNCPYLILILLLVACQPTPQKEKVLDTADKQALLSQAEQMSLKGQVKLVIETIDESLNSEPFDIDWSETYIYSYISEEQGIVPQMWMMPDEVDEYVPMDDDDEFLVDEDGEVIVPDEDDISYEDADEEGDFDIEPSLVIYEERGSHQEDETPLVQYWFDEKGDFTHIGYYGADNGAAERKETYKYDDKHQMLEHKVLDSDGKIINSYTSQFDSLGNEVYTESFSIYSNDGEVRKTNTTYTMDSKLFRSETTVRGKVVGLSEHQYDEHGNCIYSSYKGSYSNSSKMEYNSDDKLVKETTYNAAGKVQTINSYLYDNRSNMTQSLLTSYYDNPDGEEVQHVVCEYDNRGNCTKYSTYYYGKLENEEISKFDANNNVIYNHLTYFDYVDDTTIDTIVTVTTYKYNKQGLLLQTTYCSGDRGNVLIRITNSYTADGQIKEERVYRTSLLEERFCGKGNAPERLVERRVYTYDSHGNWIKKEYFNTIRRDEDCGRRGETREDYEEVLTGSRTRRIEYY